MPNQSSSSQRPARTARSGGQGKAPKREVVKTWAFDSVGDRKYALQIQRASNGNPCMRLVEGVPQDDGTFRKFSLTIWSEDWPALFRTLEELRAYVEANDIRTPEGHKFVPGKGRGKRSGV
jgi:hypothetical protein